MFQIKSNKNLNKQTFFETGKILQVGFKGHSKFENLLLFFFWC